MNPEDAAVQAADISASPSGAFIKDGTVTDVIGNNATVAVDGGGTARPTILGTIPVVDQRVTMLFDPADNGTCVILGTIGGFTPVTLEDFYTVGSLYFSYLSTDPATVLGFGTWVAIAQGEAIVGFKAADTPFGTVGSIGGAGAKTVTLAATEMPVHTHTGPSHTHTGPDHSHTGPTGTWFRYVSSGGSRADGGTGAGYDRNTLGSTGNAGTGNTGAAGTGDTGAAGGSAGVTQGHNNIQPSFVVYVWRRTA